MNCVEFERVLPEYLEGGRTDEQLAHLNSCSECAGLLADLSFISSQARTLQGCEDPRPVVWDGLEVLLRREGLIRGDGSQQATPARSSLADFFRKRRAVWLIPVAAALIVAAGLKLYRPTGAGDTSPVARVTVPMPATPNRANAVSSNTAPSNSVSNEDQQVLNSMAARLPLQQARYRQNLDEANSYIRDAEQSIRNDPNDVYSRELLINAYEQKQMLYDLAVNRTGQQ